MPTRLAMPRMSIDWSGVYIAGRSLGDKTEPGVAESYHIGITQSESKTYQEAEDREGVNGID